MAVYLLHFDRPYRHARHYLGYTTDLEGRLALHAKPDGSSHHRLMQVIYAAGIGFTLARLWPDGTRALERQLKSYAAGPRLCPICTPGKTLLGQAQTSRLRVPKVRHGTRQRANANRGMVHDVASPDGEIGY